MQLDLVDAGGSAKRNESAKALQDLQAFHLHFAVKERQHQAALTQGKPEPGHVYVQFDFMQDLSVLQSGTGPGSWWYGNCRVEYTLSGAMLVFISSGARRAKYATYVTDTLDHDGLIACGFLERLLAHVPRDAVKLNLWSDCGLHFRCYQLACWTLVELPRKMPREPGEEVTVRLQLFCEMHGKGPCDGHLSAPKEWIFGHCVAGGVVSSLSHVWEALDDGAASSMRLYSPPVGPECHSEIVDTAALGRKPACFKEIAAYGADPAMLRRSKTYCLASSLIPPAHRPVRGRQRPDLIYDIRIDDHVFADRGHCQRVGARARWIRTKTTCVPPTGREWEIGWRDRVPEFNHVWVHARYTYLLFPNLFRSGTD